MDRYDAYLEVGSKKVFAGAVDWPGWCRVAKEEAAALQELLDYAPRYERAMRAGGVAFEPPRSLEDLTVVERHAGTPTTDFGAPDASPDADRQPFTEAALDRALRVMDACWRVLEDAAQSARGKELKKGPRGGGRALEKILEHALDSQRGYLNQIAWKAKPGEAASDPFAAIARARQDVRDALTAAQREGVPERGPRGGKLWTARYFVRRSAWHLLDHAWEIEDRVLH